MNLALRLAPAFVSVVCLVAAPSGAAVPVLNELRAEYHDLAAQAEPLLTAVREARRDGNISDRDQVLFLRKAIGDLLKKIRRYDQEHVLALRRRQIPYDERRQVLDLLRAADEMNRTLEAEMRANDWLRLAEKSEQAWRRAHEQIVEKQQP
ncbi:hypothetical protein [Candidatus Nitrospira bockiana]